MVWYVAKGVPSLRGRALFGQLRASFQRCCEKPGFRVTNFLVERAAVRLLVEADDNESLSRGMQGLGVSMAKRINLAAGRYGPAFTDRYSVRPITTLAQARKELDDILVPLECPACGKLVERPSTPGQFTSHSEAALADRLTALPRTGLLRAASPARWDFSIGRQLGRSG